MLLSFWGEIEALSLEERGLGRNQEPLSQRLLLIRSAGFEENSTLWARVLTQKRSAPCSHVSHVQIRLHSEAFAFRGSVSFSGCSAYAQVGFHDAVHH